MNTFYFFAGKFKISAESDLAPFFGHGTKVKIPSEIKQHLKKKVYHSSPLNQASLFHRSVAAAALKVSKSQKQNTKFSHTPKKNQQFFLHFFLASKKRFKQTNKKNEI